MCHFLAFITPADAEKCKEKADRLGGWKRGIYALDMEYELALKRAKTIGGRKFHNKQYGGGIVFQSYNIKDEERAINELLSNL